MDIRRAVKTANRDHPEEALQPSSEHREDLTSHYEYIVEHKAMLEKLGIKE